MLNRKECPECAGWNTERVHVEWWSDSVRETRICDDRPTEYTIDYGDPQILDVRTDE